MVEIDLSAKMIDDDHNVFFVRPGKGYHLYYSVIESNAIIVDLPDLDLESGISFSRQPFLLQKLHRSRAIRNWYRERSLDPNAPFPSRDLNTYPDSVKDLGISQLRAVTERYFSSSKLGDLVVVIPGPYTSNVYIGDLAGNPTDIATFEFPEIYDGEQLLGRNVNWLATVPKKRLSNQILEIASKPNAFVLLPKEVRRDLYRLAYPNYVSETEANARFDVTKNDFTSRDDFLIQAFFNSVASNTAAIDLKGQVLPFESAAFVDAGGYTPDLSTEVNSPGYLNLSSLKYVPLVIAALYAAATQIGPQAHQAAESGTLRIGNSLAAPDDPCVADVQRLAVDQIVLLGAEGWAEACEKAHRARERNGLKGSAKVKR